MAYDNVRKTTILFGGLADTGGARQPVKDTWEWDGTRWTQIADTGPGARANAAMTSTDGALVLHGGEFQQVFGDTWLWTAGGWSKMQDIGPPPRRGHAMAYNTDEQRIVLFGGEIQTTPDGGGGALIDAYARAARHQRAAGDVVSVASSQ